MNNLFTSLVCPSTNLRIARVVWWSVLVLLPFFPPGGNPQGKNGGNPGGKNGGSYGGIPEAKNGGSYGGNLRAKNGGNYPLHFFPSPLPYFISKFPQLIFTTPLFRQVSFPHTELPQLPLVFGSPPSTGQGIV